MYIYIDIYLCSAAGGEWLPPRSSNIMGVLHAQLYVFVVSLYKASWQCCWMQISNSSSRHAADMHAGNLNKDGNQQS